MPRIPGSSRNGRWVNGNGLVNAYLDAVVDDVYRRFEEKFAVDPVTGCWNWAASKTKQGYGRISFFKGYVPAYRVAYELYVGPIPQGLYIDHLCRNPSCVYPDHLEPVTNAENVRRGRAVLSYKERGLPLKTHCKRGHEYDETRVCRHCKNELKRAYRARLAGRSPGDPPRRNLEGLKLGGAANGARQRAKTHCPQGHEYSPENTYLYAGWRQCRRCHHDRELRRQALKCSRAAA